MRNESHLKFLFVFDTSFFWSLIDIGEIEVVEEIKEIFDYNSSIDYIAPNIILKEMSGKYRSKLPYLQKHIHFEAEEINDSEIEELISINNSLPQRCFERGEKGDFKVIQTAIKRRIRNGITLVVSNDEGFHTFINGALKEKGIKVVWGNSLLDFLSSYAIKMETMLKLKRTADKVYTKLQNYRDKTDRGIIPTKDFDKVLIYSSTIQDDNTQIPLEIERSFDNYINNRFDKTIHIPRSYKEIGNLIINTLSVLNLGDSSTIENELEKIDQYLLDIKPAEKSKITLLIESYMLSIFIKLAKIYDENREYSATVSALKRAKIFTNHTNENSKNRDQLLILLAWVHLLNNSDSLAKYYFTKVSDLGSSVIAKKTALLIKISDIPSDKLLENGLKQFDHSLLVELNRNLITSRNEKLVEKLRILLQEIDKKTSITLDARHFAIKNKKIAEEQLLKTLIVREYAIKEKIKRDQLILICQNESIGEIEFRLPKINKLLGVNKGQIIMLMNGKVEKITKTRPGVKSKARIYISEINPDDIILKKTSNI